MNKVIEFTKIRFIMFAVSIIVIIAGIAGVAVQGEFNLGIDFVGGFNQQIQFAPVAFSMKYDGDGTASALIRNGAVEVSIIAQGESSDYSYSFTDYETVEKLVEDIRRIDGIIIDLKSNNTAMPSRLLASDFEAKVSKFDSLNVNIGALNENEIIATKEEVVSALNEIGRVSVQSVGNPLEQQFLIKIHLKDIQTGDEEEGLDQTGVELKVKNLLAKKFDKDAIIFRKNDFIGPSFSVEIVQGALSSISLAIILILLYITFRFKFSYALGAITALLHDVTVMIVIIGVFQLEVTATTIAAILTIIGYSLNDTIVVYDRIRENFNLLRDQDRESIINTSITQSLSRTLITSLTTLLAVVSIYIIGTGVIKDFAFNLIIGILVGTYSSIFIASPIVLGVLNTAEKNKKANLVKKAAAKDKKK